jgi:nickel-type superoxide dismutase maturation protease
MIPPRGFLLRFGLLLTLIAGAAFLMTEEVARPWAVSGPSMAPTLREGDRVLVDVWSYRYRLPYPGEIVVLEAPGPGSILVKRVRRITARSGAAEVWVVGDAADRSVDSRVFGAVPLDRILGRVVLRYWPPSAFGRIDSKDPNSLSPSAPER